MLSSVNPVNGEVIQVYQADSDQVVESKIEAAQQAWWHWKQTSFQQRSELLNQVAIVLRGKVNELAALMALEMGKPLAEGSMEIEKCACVCEYYAANGETFLKDEPIATDARISYVSYRPLGVVLAIMPWNFPFWQVFRFLAPVLMAGNCALLKHASNVPGCALAIQDILQQAGAPTGIFHTLLVGSNAVAKIIDHEAVQAVAFTGSTHAGSRVAAAAGAALKKLVLELGGSDPYIILEDADLELAARVCTDSRLVNNGQSCVAAKRFIVMRSVAEPFLNRVRSNMEAKKIGNPLHDQVDLGPMARVDLRDELHAQVQANLKAGATCLLGGQIPAFEGSHAFYTPTILTNIQKEMPAYREELFGPVATVITVESIEEAIQVANDTHFGLGAAVFTQNLSLGETIAKEALEAGCCFINSMVKSDPRLPFGGIRQSGYGRELGPYGIREFVNIKTVCG